MTDFSTFHVERINQAHQRLDEHDSRLKSVETHVAVSAERDRHIQQSLADIKGGVTWLQRTVFGAILLAIVGFLLAGGLNGAP